MAGAGHPMVNLDPELPSANYGFVATQSVITLGYED